jgi:cytoskeletal protein RodZ
VESLGDILKAAREKKGYSHDYASRETNISGRYILALEQEDFSCFPGEPYILGFLKIYGAFLDLNAGELLSLYRAHKIQEQTVPIDQLIKGPPQLPRILGIIFIVLAVLGIAGAGVWFFLNRPKQPSTEFPAVRNPVEYPMNTGIFERRFYPGDTILVSLEGNDYKLVLTGLGETVSITTPLGVNILDMGQDTQLDLTGTGQPDLKISLADFSKNNANAGALLRFELESYPEVVSVPEITVSEISARTPGLQGAQVIFNSSNAYPFTLQALFQGYCLFRWEIIAERDRQGRNEQYFQRSDERSIQAQNGIRIGLSNATAVKLQIIGGGRTVPLELGIAGEVVVADIRWVRDEDNRFRLVLLRLD